MASRRAVSQIIGTLIMLAIVAVAGGVLLIKGIQVMADFNSNIDAQGTRDVERVQEKLVITHARFYGASSDQVDIHVINVGDIDSYVSTIVIINKEADQQIRVCCDNPARTYLPIHTPVKITTSLSPDWISGDNFKISLTTEQDNSFTKVARAPNG